MKNCFSAFRPGLLAALIAAVVPAVSCYQSAQPPAPPPAPSDIGRFQVVVTAEGERGTVLFLLDTKEGGTWIYRPPQGAVVNGYWSDIPRLTYGAEFWQRAFSQMAQQAAQASQVTAPPGGTAGAITNAPELPATNR